MKNRDNAVNNFNHNCNCCQAVLLTYARKFGMEKELASMVASGFGGGMASLGKTCGAVTGAYMTLGLHSGTLHSDNSKIKETTKNLITEFNKRFMAEFVSLECKDILGYDLSIDGERKKAADLNLFEIKCSNFVGKATEIIDDLIND